MAGLVPAIHVGEATWPTTMGSPAGFVIRLIEQRPDVDGRHKAGHDERVL